MTPTRDRIVEASADLFRRQGYSGTGVKQIVATASAPFGSLYHFFPGGKVQLGEEVIRWSGEIYGQLIDAFYGPGVDLVEATRAFYAAAAQNLVETDYADACPIATIALEVASTNEPMRCATADVFEGWVTKAAERFQQDGIDPAPAREAATAVIAILEGAFILCRASRTTEALDVAGRVAADLVQRTTANRSRSRATRSRSTGSGRAQVASPHRSADTR